MSYLLSIQYLKDNRNNINSKCDDRSNDGSDLPDVVLFVHFCFFFRGWLFENSDFFKAGCHTDGKSNQLWLLLTGDTMICFHLIKVNYRIQSI